MLRRIQTLFTAQATAPSPRLLNQNETERETILADVARYIQAGKKSSRSAASLGAKAVRNKQKGS